MKLKELIKLARPVNVVISWISIFLAALVSGSIQPLQNVLLACFSGAFITIAANAINDVFDVEIDRINKPDRPIASGSISIKTAQLYSALFFLIGIICGALINLATFVIVIIFSVLLYYYSKIFKRTVFWGNFVVSLSTAFAFIYGGVAVNRASYAIFPALFAFFMHFGREIIKDMEDVEGDKKDNANTLPVKYGINPAQWLTSTLLIVLVALTLVPFFMNVYGLWYLVTVSILVNTVLLFTVFSLWRKPTRKNFNFLSTLLKADMLAGLLAIYVGRF